MYSTLADILFDLPKNELINLVNDENRNIDLINLNDPNDICVQRVNKAITDADNEINDYIRSRYKLPLATIPGSIIKISKDIAIYNLYLRRFKVETPYREIYLSRIAELKLIQAGKVNLDIDNEEDSSPIYSTNKKSSDRLFNNTTLTQYWNNDAY